MDVLALAFVLLALPGLMIRRLGPWMARVAAAIALCALWVATTDPQVPHEETEPPRVALSFTGSPLPAPRIGELRGRLPEASDWSTHERGGLPGRLQAAALRAGSRPGELLVAWTGPVDGAPGDSPLVRPFAALADLPGLPIDPQAVSVRAETAFAASRPGLLACAAAGLRETMPARLVVRDPQGATVFDEEVLLRAEGTTAVAFTPEVEGAHSVALELRVGDVRIARRGGLSVAPPPRVLVVGRRAAELAPALDVQGMASEAAVELPADLSPYAAVVVLDGIPAARQEDLARAVEDGKGLLVVGLAFPLAGEPMDRLLPVRPEAGAEPPGAGEGTGPASPTESPPDRPQPPDPRPPDQPPVQPPDRPPTGDTGEARLDPGPPAEVERRNIAMVLVVDRSGSMGEAVRGRATKMDYAKRSAYETARALGAGDQVGIVTFGNREAARVELSMTPATEGRVLRERIERLAQTGDTTYLASGLRQAGELLRDAKAPVKHVLVISDGQFHDAPLVLPAIARQLRTRDRLTVSIIQVIPAGSNPLWVEESNRIVQEGGGAYHLTRDPTKIPLLVSLEVTRALDRVGRKPAGLPSNEGQGEPATEPTVPTTDPEPEPETPAADPQPRDPEPRPDSPHDIPVRAVADSVLLDPRPESWPAIAGLVGSRGTHDARVLLVAGTEGRPLLAFGNRGLGRVAAWTSDLVGPWAAAWRADPAFPGRLALWVQSLLPASPASSAPELLSATEVEPLRPAPRELTALAVWSGGPVLAPDQWSPPGARRVLRHRGQARELAFWAAAALALLALVEFVAARLGGRSTV